MQKKISLLVLLMLLVLSACSGEKGKPADKEENLQEAVTTNAKEKEKENRFFLQWVVQLPNMTKENYVSFESYLDKVTGRNIETRPVYECMEELEEIKKLFEQ